MGEFAGGKVDPVEAGKKGGQTSGSGSGGSAQSGGDKYKPSEHDGLKQDGTPDKRVQQTEFAHGKVDPHEAGKKGGETS